MIESVVLLNLCGNTKKQDKWWLAQHPTPEQKGSVSAQALPWHTCTVEVWKCRSRDRRNWIGCDRGVRRTYVGPTGRCWGSGSWGTAPGVCPGDLVPSGCSLPNDQRNKPHLHQVKLTSNTSRAVHVTLSISIWWNNVKGWRVCFALQFLFPNFCFPENTSLGSLTLHKRIKCKSATVWHAAICEEEVILSILIFVCYLLCKLRVPWEFAEVHEL